MLTDPLLIKLVEDKGLLEWKPIPELPLQRVRTILFTPEVHEELYRDPWDREPEDSSGRDARTRRRSMHAAIGNFVGGRRLAPQFDVTALDARDDPIFTNLLEIRSGPPQPQARVFFYVFTPGVWIAVGFKRRSELGEFGDPRWADAAKKCSECWSACFDQRQPHPSQPCNTFAQLRALSDA